MSLQQITESQANPEIPINRNFETLEHQGVYGQRQSAHSGLTWGYYGGRWGGFSVSDGTLSLTNAASNYVVVENATGTISVSTASTNWDDTADYSRVYLITTAGSVVTAVQDHRAGPSGVHYGGSTGGGAVSSVNGQTGAVSLDSYDIEHADPEAAFGSPATVGNALDELADLKIDSWDGMIEEPENKTYTLVLKASFPGVILETTTDATSGTGTATFEINGTPLGGTANSVSTSEQSQTHGSANSFVSGDTITLEMSAIGSPSLTDMSFSVRYRRALA